MPRRLAQQRVTLNGRFTNRALSLRYLWASCSSLMLEHKAINYC